MTAVVAPPILPLYFYRYRSFGREGELLVRELTALKENFIYCSSFKHLNDPMEGFFTPSALLKARHEFAEIAAAIYESKINIGVAALSDTYENELMWTHYADEYRGICVEYYADRLQSQLPQECTLARVGYVNEPTRISAAARKDTEAAARKVLSQKKASWFYEREWRILGPVGPVHARGFRPVLRSIHLGSRILDEHKQQILQRFPDIDIWQMTIDGYDHEWTCLRAARPRSKRPGGGSGRGVGVKTDDLLGSKISLRTLKARWAWSELTSPRFAKKYAGLGANAKRLQNLAKNGATFDELRESDHDILASLIEIRQPGFVQDIAHVKEFVCVEWTKDQLLSVDAIPAMSPGKDRIISYSDFIKSPPHIVSGKPEWSDPRVSAESWPLGKEFQQNEPAIALVGPSKRMILIDGYGRSVIFIRHGNSSDRFKVWVPAS